MHTATRLALPVIRSRSRDQSWRHDLRVRAVRADCPSRCFASPASRSCSGRRPRLISSGSRQAVRRQELTRSLRDGCRDSRSPRPIGPRCRRSPDTRRCSSPTALAVSPAPPTRRAAASIAAGTVRSCRSTTGSSASCRWTSCSPTSISRWLRGASHITFGDPDFFNGPTHARRIVEALHERHPAVTYDVTIKVEHLLRRARAAAGAGADRLRVRDQRGRSGGRRDSREAREGPHAGGLRHRGRGCAAMPGWCWRRPSSRSRRGRRSRAIAICSTPSRRSDSSSTWRRSSGDCVCWSPRARGCSSSTTSAATVRPFDSRDADLSVVARRSARRSAAGGDHGDDRRAA